MNIINSYEKFLPFCIKTRVVGCADLYDRLASLSYSQLAQEQTEDISPEQLSIAVSNSIDDLKKRLNELNLKASGNAFAAKEQTIRRNASQTQDAAEKDRLLSNLSGVVDTWKLRVSEVTKGAAGIEGQLLETEKIHSDLKENFAGRMEEAKPALDVVRENLDRSSNECCHGSTFNQCDQ